MMKFKQGKNLLVDARGNPIKPMGSQTGYQSADYNRYNADFQVVLFAPNQLVALAGRQLRARAQDLERNSDHVRRFLMLVENNVIGWNGIRLQSKATRSELTETPDRNAIRLIEYEWANWATEENCSVTGEDSWVDIQKLLIRRRIVDGEVFLEMLPGHGNESRFAVRTWGADACPMGYSDEGRRIYNGIRYDEWGKPLSYFMHRGGHSTLWGKESAGDLVEIPAERMRHLFRRERPGQRRGITELSSTAERMHMLDKYERSVLIGAQIASSKMGFFRDPDGMTLDTYVGDGPESPNSRENTIDIQPGQFEDIGQKRFEKFDVEYPPAKYEEFVHEVIRSAASGLNISYHVLANDPASVNYSTAREFRLQDTDAWRDHQHTFARKICQPVFKEWLRIQLLKSPLNRYRQSDFKRLSFVKWQPRGWQWVDPQKEGAGNEIAVRMGSKSYTDIAAEQGRDFEEVVEQIQRDKEFAAQHGVTLGEVAALIAPPEPDDDETPSADSEISR
jgi:lambda family phage portal protein